MARVRTKGNGNLEIVDMQHNHDILTERRKKGVLKAMYAQKLKQKQQKTAQPKWTIFNASKQISIRF